MEFLNHPVLMIAVGILSIPIYVVLAKLFWGDNFETLGDTVKYLVWPDIYSFFKGELWEDQFATAKFSLYPFLCFGWTAAITELLSRLVL